MTNLNAEAFAQAETSFNSIKRLVTSWIPANTSGQQHDHAVKSVISLYESIPKAKSIKMSMAEKAKKELEQSTIALEEEEKGMKSGSVKKRKQTDVLNVLLIN
jgi:hypothetical protein